MVLLCKVLGVSKSGYYAYIKRPSRKIGKGDREILSLIKRIYNRHQGTYGAKRISKVLKNKGIVVNHKRVARLMKVTNLKAKVRRPKTTKESKVQAAGFVYENILKRNFKADHPNKKWVTDMTEVWIGSHKRCISAILDLFNSEIIAFEISTSPNTELIEATVKKAMKNRNLKDLKGVVIHSDQGSVYRSLSYNELSKNLHFTPSMSRKANCWDNAVIESFFSQLKSEFPCFYPTNNIKTSDTNFKKYVHYYNEERIHTRTGFVSPSEYYKDYIQTKKLGLCLSNFKAAT
ncbi:IS3 family transposase [Metabacillus litoralis]|uniref:IS3 family transposase n=1 Tax=Metabacillus litoralis TaxID=152268 RepID=UPI001E2DD337|nr:IS3 family transposase [Metabacillus litoralis]UHA60607.1 IS3 family transposase [Metabacillus litoralis]